MVYSNNNVDCVTSYGICKRQEINISTYTTTTRFIDSNCKPFLLLESTKMIRLSTFYISRKLFWRVDCHAIPGPVDPAIHA